MAPSTCVACTVESWYRSGTTGFDDTQHTCAKNPHISPQYLRGDFNSETNGTASAYSFDNYQDDAGTTAIYPDSDSGSTAAINYTILGLIGEAGEIANKWKKVYRDYPALIENNDYPSTVRDAIKAELGDVLWYCARLASELGVQLSTIAAKNYDKLNERKSRNVLGGSGDTR